MDKLEELGFLGLQNYFHALSIYGYKDYNEVDKLLVLLFIAEIVNSDLGYYITDEDYKILNQVLYKLYGTTCLIPYPKLNCNSASNAALNIIPRISQNNIMRTTTNNIIRIASL